MGAWGAGTWRAHVATERSSATILARLLHQLDVVLVHPAAADPVDQSVDLHVGARSVGEGFGEVVPDLVRPVDVGREGEARLCASDRAQHRGKDLFPVLYRVDSIAFDDSRPTKDAQGPQELRFMDVVRNETGPVGAPARSRHTTPRGAGPGQDGTTQVDTQKPRTEQAAAKFNSFHHFRMIVSIAFRNGALRHSRGDRNGHAVADPGASLVAPLRRSRLFLTCKRVRPREMPSTR